MSRRIFWSCGVLFCVILLLAGCGGSQTYVVRTGDSLPNIALDHEIALTDLIKANQDRYPSLAVDPENPQPGIELVIPVESDAGIEEWFARLTRAASPPVTPAADVPAAPNEKINAVSQTHSTRYQPRTRRA